MKTYTGSLQRRGKRYYLVVHKEGRQRWISLKTEKLTVARFRAARIAPADLGEERAWLEQLVRVGEQARRTLMRMRTACVVTWDAIADYCAATLDVGVSEDLRQVHGHWLRCLAATLHERSINTAPVSLSAEEASTAMKGLAGQYLSAERMLAYYRRVWNHLGFDVKVWPRRAPLVAQGREREHYRRLSVEEIGIVHADLAVRDPALADMLLIGYSTGLRLSDVAELERSELALPFLRVCPNKTRKRKPNPLKIPLTDEALEVLVRLDLAAERGKAGYLFDARSRHRPSRRLSAAFRRCGVVKSGTGRASFHSLRATFISMMDDAGVPPHITDAITGHGGGGMHARYTQPSDEALRAAVARAIPRLPHHTA